MLDVLDDVLRIITSGVVAIAAISLLVGAVGILTVMWISVGERTHEIGLLRALGATVADVRALFLLEAAALGGIGAVLGLTLGLGLGRLLGALVPGLPVATPVSFVVVGLLGSTVTGLVSGLAPAHRAALLDPTDALRND